MALKKKKTVSKIIGSSRELKDDVLPSKKDVLKYYLLCNRTALPRIRDKILEIWKCVGVPTITEQGIMKALRKLQYQYRKYDIKTTKRTKNGSLEVNRKKFQKELHNL